MSNIKFKKIMQEIWDSCLLMDPNQDFPLSKSHVFWWTQFLHIFSKFSPLKPHVFWWTHFSTQTSCLLMDPNLMSFNEPLMIFWVHQKTWGFWVHRKTWVHKKLMSFDGPRFSNLSGSIIRHEVLNFVLGPSKHMRFFSAVFTWTLLELILVRFMIEFSVLNR